MISREFLRQKAHNRFSDVMRALLREENPFPLSLRIRLPSTTAPLAELRQVNRVLREESVERLGHGFTVEWERVNTRKYGSNAIARRLTFANAEDYFGYLGKADEAQRIQKNAKAVIQAFPATRDWVQGNPVMLAKPGIAIRRAIQVIQHLEAHACAELYARQLPLPIPTKFVEQERGLLLALASHGAPGILISPDGVFEERAGLRMKESLLEFRSLDPENDVLFLRHGKAAASELTRHAAIFDRFARVFVIENHVSFLTFPPVAGAVALMGHGFAVHRFTNVNWFPTRDHVHYWGDLDVPGFHILAQLRLRVPQTRSFLMDLATMEAFEPFTTAREESCVFPEELRRVLTPSEREALDRLVSTGRRLEQEHISLDYIRMQER